MSWYGDYLEGRNKKEIDESLKRERLINLAPELLKTAKSLLTALEGPLCNAVNAMNALQMIIKKIEK